MITAIAKPITSIPVFVGDDLTVVNGANEGDALSFAGDLVPDDTYWFRDEAKVVRLAVETNEDGSIAIGPGSETGTVGAPLHLDSCLTFMSPDGATTEVLVLVETDAAGHVAEIYALPLARLSPQTDYVLVGVDTASVARKFAEIACVSFSAGTLITLASGAQRPIEQLKVGDRVLTRNDGAQEIRWIGHSTVRAVGEFAPIVIKAGTLSNENDLILSPDHRLFIYQREDVIGAGHREVLVRARHLLNGDTIYRQDGGFIEYYQLLFDRHQIIYAEGIAAETLLVDRRTRAALPSELDQRMTNHADRPHLKFEIKRQLLDRPDALDLLRRASRSPWRAT